MAPPPRAAIRVVFASHTPGNREDGGMTVLVFGHRNPDTDAIASALALAWLEVALGTDAHAVALGPPNPETAHALACFGVDAPRVIERARPETDQVMLVDHNERQQSVADIDEVTVLRVVDHHRVANFTSVLPLYFRVEPVGCTCTILARMYAENAVPIPRAIAGMMVSAIISDTLLLRSVTTTDDDRRVAAELAGIAGIDLDTYGDALLRAGAALGDLGAAELIDRDAKSYTLGTTQVRLSQISSTDPTEVLDRRDEFLAAMEAERVRAGEDLLLLFVTDVLRGDSELLVVGEPVAAVEKSFSVTVVDGHAHLPGVVSRKKQVVPPLTAALR
ncbi:inorganic pyrophosphatase [Gordonia polyisoprenivorans NBRC 16320 = JCM 10675]|nr:inorganic pyrophosphatase [Gordonia polyisoprenivorans NBRC 16320 = JCM 10675]